MIQIVNWSEFINKELSQCFMKLNVEELLGLSYFPKSQGAVKGFNKTIQKI